MKYCNRCKMTLSNYQFGGNKSRYDKLQPYCKDCMKKYRKEHYRKDSDRYKQRAKDKRKFLKKFVRRVKRLSTCRCGESRWWVLEFHHLDPSHKDETISRITLDGSMSKLKDEIRKCEIVCANCHRDIHYNQRLEAKETVV